MNKIHLIVALLGILGVCLIIVFKESFGYLFIGIMFAHLITSGITEKGDDK